MTEIIDHFFAPMLIRNGFIHDPDNQQYGSMGDCWRLSPEIGEGTYWTYGQKDLYDIKIHNFSFREDYLLEFSLPNYLNIARYDSISGEELSPYRRLSAGCIKTYIGGSSPYKALIHKNIPVRSIGIGIAPAYYEDYLKAVSGGQRLIQSLLFARLMRRQIFRKCHSCSLRSEIIAEKDSLRSFFTKEKVAEAVSLVVAFQLKYPDKQPRILSQQDIESVRTVAAYLNDHYAADIPLERLAQIACMGTTKLKSCFKKYYHCTITEYIQQRRMSQAEYLLASSELSIGQIAQTVGYSTSSRFATLFRKSTGLLPREYRKATQQK